LFAAFAGITKGSPALSTEETTMDVLSIIKQEHREVSDLFDEANKCEPGDERLRDLTRVIMEKLTMHLAIEERLFYSTLKQRAEKDEDSVDVFEGYTEHDVAKQLMEMLRSGRKPDEKFKAEVQVLSESVKHHVQEEESTIFSIAKKLIDGEEREAIGESWERSKARAQKSGASNGAARKKPTARKKVTTRKKTRR
jgi:hemerythrin-like domain-containing protein